MSCAPGKRKILLIAANDNLPDSVRWRRVSGWLALAIAAAAGLYFLA